ncbi:MULTISPECIES: DUF2170 family protein [Alteromonadaceae]|uniref:DUF2170 family protein n=1 Tax=Alteromonadaceae TaxID=72275 RepID=UPI001C09AF75|nr:MULTISPECIES: DUF2170 family protein [Aliiglaciecola]MBU2879754.1 YjfI family protein [Aliiglaciecola lipolytica]MDO6709967.1 DUF2170 family protein [Aliiglaciecola sp. 2_MG-2023]MDO6751115.1 DUF2170 family protein [Aliiglaciecola sp. 1_MG-2023]
MTWDLDQLETLLSKNDNIVVTREDNCLLIGNGDGLDAWLALSGEQIIIESILFSSSEVKDKAALNEEILKTHMLFPLTTIGISQVAEQDYYTAFGALSSQSKAESIQIELDALFHNVAAFLDAYQEHLH